MCIDPVTEGRLIVIVADGVDAGIRRADLVPRDMIAIPIGQPFQMAVVGSLAYFAGREKPSSPGDLAAHRCIRARQPSGAAVGWEFVRHGEPLTVNVNGPLLLDEPTLMHTAARDGLGLAMLADWYVKDDLERGTLVRVLGDWSPTYPALCLYYSGCRNLPLPLRALVDLIREMGGIL